ncbi:MAG TPA: MopE-related protein, partial [Myxococcota bacterium]|nr:MopE-related protein [Myxococcota bacterium]
YADGDLDGYGAGVTTRACSQPAGYAGLGGDCNDNNAAVRPGAAELCNSADDDCDGVVDDNPTGAPTWYRDADRDGYGNIDFTRVQCTQPSGFVADATDCLDSVATVYPGAPEACDGLDNDCDAVVDDNATGTRTWYRDGDGDGFGDPSVRTTSCTQPSGYVLDGRDCRDDLVAVNPAAVERCDSVDNNCDSVVDTDAIDRVTWYVDADRDTYGAATGGQACAVPANGSLQRGDCDDARADTFPGAAEVCDTRDNNCDGIVDGPNPVGASTWYLDFDHDGHAGSAVTVVACAAPQFYLASADDCDDGVAVSYPGAPELCDGRDNDCDTQIDEGVVNPITFYLDGDGDGFGGATGSVRACVNPGGYVSTGGDCNDANALVRPGATEYCDTIDNNCNGQTDEAAAVDAITWYQDSDADLYGNSARPLVACEQPTGYVGDNSDCNDLQAADHPGGTERCDGRDNDCDRVTDENDAVDATVWYLDTDNDQYGVSTTTLRQCVRPAGYAPVAGDCDNGRATVNPAAPEVCDSLDNNCNGVTDGSEALDAATWYRDADADTFGNLALTARSCVQPSGYVSNDDDCDDTRNAVRPTGTEVCNGIDDDCSSDIDDHTAVCPYPVYNTGGHAYFFSTGALPWTQARDYCVARGYYLLVINDFVENFWTDGISDYYSEAKWWTGMNDLSQEGRWVWVNGDAVTYTNWHAGEPNNVFSGTYNQDEDCMQFNRYGDGTWNDEWCSQAFMFICEAGR